MRMSLAYGDPDIKANAMTGRSDLHIMYLYMPEDFKAKTVPFFNSDLTVKKLFGTKDTTTITSTYADYAFSLPSELYTIQAGDRIGIKYTGGNSNNYAAVTLDRDAADPFDGANTYRQQYNTSWLSYTSDDMYMMLRQTHG